MFSITMLSRQLWLYVQPEKGSQSNYWLPAPMNILPPSMKHNDHQTVTVLTPSLPHQRHMIY